MNHYQFFSDRTPPDFCLHIYIYRLLGGRRQPFLFDSNKSFMLIFISFSIRFRPLTTRCKHTYIGYLETVQHVHAYYGRLHRQPSTCCLPVRPPHCHRCHFCNYIHPIYLSSCTLHVYHVCPQCLATNVPFCHLLGKSCTRTACCQHQHDVDVIWGCF